MADGKPPVTWSETKNVKWRVPLANWGYAAPVVAEGRVFVMTEPGWKHDFPVLNCFDADTGKLLWQREVNQLPATGLSEEQQAAAWRSTATSWQSGARPTGSSTTGSRALMPKVR